MAKVNIVKPTGNEAFNVLSAFKADNQSYIILDSEKIGSMGLPIIYISKYNDKLEKIADETEWQNVKNYLKGIIGGTNFEYIAVPDSVNASDAYYTPLTLPQASFDLIKSRYVAPASSVEPISISNLDTPTETVADLINAAAPTETQPVMTSPVMPVEQPTASNIPIEPVQPISPEPINMAMPEVNAPAVEPFVQASPEVIPAVAPTIEPVPAPIEMPSVPEVKEEPVMASPVEQVSTPVMNEPVLEEESSPVTGSVSDVSIFEADKETFLKACENMFDALISKYQGKINELNRREEELTLKEQEITTKLASASEHLANAEAREQVANIAHDNAQRIMDMNKNI